MQVPTERITSGPALEWVFQEAGPEEVSLPGIRWQRCGWQVKEETSVSGQKAQHEQRLSGRKERGALQDEKMSSTGGGHRASSGRWWAREHAHVCVHVQVCACESGCLCKVG